MTSGEPAVVRVLIVDYSIGFGGATKSMGLMLAGVKGVEAIVLTSQKPDIRRLWYSQWKTYGFRRLVNYRTKATVSEWLAASSAPRLARLAVNKLVAIVDGFTSMINVLKLAYLIRRHRIDVLHLANGFLPPAALFAARLTGVASIAHLRCFFSGTSGQRLHAPTLVIGDSEAVTVSYLEAAVRSRAPAMTLYEVVDVDRFDDARDRRLTVREGWAVPGNAVVVGIFGRIMKWKGQREFVLAMIASMRENERLFGLIVGDFSDGTREYRDNIEELISRSGFSARFHMTGYVEEVEPLYWGVDIVVHASTEPEPCGMVVMEAMAARRPVIAANAGGPKELVRHGVDGYLTTPGCVEELAGAILDVARDPQMAGAMGAAGYQRAREMFDVPIASAILQTIYSSLASSGVAKWADGWAGYLPDVQQAEAS